ncbi:MAG: SIMPL domain-containing protein [Candidatus Eremiobacteraeota bacterium]|nr:SIMPL domain-containing protein [Candidatus Eremiobacteraeota bacterium]
MKRVWIGVWFSVLLPATAAAQSVRPLFPPGNAPPVQHTQGVTVSASGLTHIEATSAHVTLRLGSRTNAAIYNAQVLGPVIDAMVRSGVDRASVQSPSLFGAPGNSGFAVISGDIAHPTTEMVQRGIAAVGAAIIAIPGAIAQDSQVTLHAQSCEAAQAKARSIAIAQAHDKASMLAKQLGITLGKVVSVSSNDQSQPDGSCANGYSISPYGPSMETSGDYLSVPVYSSVTITYAIR